MQPLIEDYSCENFSIESFSGFAANHPFSSGVSESVAKKSRTKGFFLLTTEGRSVNLATFH
jgi:hypothetical protein